MFSNKLCADTLSNIISKARGDEIVKGDKLVKLTGVMGSRCMLALLYTPARQAEVARWKLNRHVIDMCPDGHISPPTKYCPRRAGADGGWAAGRRCSVCVSSRWERIIYALVQMLGLTAEKRYLESKYELDIYIPELRKAIEYNGEQHYKQGLFTPDLTARLCKDQEKVFACQRAGIRLLHVRFDDPQPVETVLSFLQN